MNLLEFRLTALKCHVKKPARGGVEIVVLDRKEIPATASRRPVNLIRCTYVNRGKLYPPGSKKRGWTNEHIRTWLAGVLGKHPGARLSPIR